MTDTERERATERMGRLLIALIGDDEALAREFVALEELSDEALLTLEMALEEETL